jgi:hypothetical protein
MASKNTELNNEIEQGKDKAFLEEYKALVEPLNDKHGRRLVPILDFSNKGIVPVFGIDRFVKQIIDVDKKLAQSKVKRQSNTDNKVSE